MEIKRVVTPLGKSLKHNLAMLDGKVGKVGWFENSKYNDKHNTPVAYVAAQNEFGNPSKNIPARPFMRPTVIEKQNEWEKIIYNGSKKIIQGQLDIGSLMQLVGLKAAGDIRKKISEIQEPALSPITIKRRLSKYKDKKTIGSLTKPLIDTSVMYSTLTNTVESA